MTRPGSHFLPNERGISSLKQHKAQGLSCLFFFFLGISGLTRGHDAYVTAQSGLYRVCNLLRAQTKQNLYLPGDGGNEHRVDKQDSTNCWLTLVATTPHHTTPLQAFWFVYTSRVIETRLVVDKDVVVRVGTGYFQDGILSVSCVQYQLSLFARDQPEGFTKKESRGLRRLSLWHVYVRMRSEEPLTQLMRNSHTCLVVSTQGMSTSGFVVAMVRMHKSHIFFPFSVN